ncbi:MAG: type II CAAX endopeptidase family protein [Psychroflexus sp.]
MNISKALLLTILFAIFFHISQVGLYFLFIGSEIFPEYFKNHWGLINIVSFISAYLVIFKYFWVNKPSVKIISDFKGLNLTNLIYLILIVFGLQLIDRPFWDMDKIWSYIIVSEFNNEISYFNGFTPAFIYSSIVSLIVSPIFEELFYRKFLLVELMHKNKKITSIIVSSLCFSILHIETPLNLIPTFIFGIISSIIFIKTNKIGYSIVLHFLMNLLIQTLYVFDFTIDRWLFDLNFNLTYWSIFLIGIGITYLGIKKLLSTAHPVKSTRFN